MKRRLLLAAFAATLTAALTLAPIGAHAGLPAVTLVVAWRWVDVAVSGAAVAAARDGAVVVGTAGSLSPRGPGRVTGTAPAGPPPAAALEVLNGEAAELVLTTEEPLQALDAVVELAPGGTVRALQARPLATTRRVTSRFAVTPAWPGGRAPVRLAWRLEDDGRAQRAVVELPLERWQAVARTGASAAPPAQGTVRSSDAAAVPQRELQLRVSLRP